MSLKLLVSILVGLVCWFPKCIPLVAGLTVYFIFRQKSIVEENLLNQAENNKRFRKDVDVLNSNHSKLLESHTSLSRQTNVLEKRQREDINSLKNEQRLLQSTLSGINKNINHDTTKKEDLHGRQRRFLRSIEKQNIVRPR